MTDIRGAHIHITGVVQGVGFRPFVFGLATRLALRGRVRNTSAGVDIEVDGSRDALEAFVSALRAEAPPLARIDSIQVEPRIANGFAAFEIVHSEPIAGAFQPLSPDVSVCPACLREMLDPTDRRYRYPFINCTHCGPRFTIIKDIPYDRPLTTMAAFEMCPDCAAEYADPRDRRFHAQPTACPECGPQVWLVMKQDTDEGGLTRMKEEIRVHPRESASHSSLSGEEAIRQARHLLAQGKIVAVKGLGGFHLACDATNADAVAELRRRKGRVDKPFALMMPDPETVERFCEVNDTERALLQSPQRPIVLLNKRADQLISPLVAPGQRTLGVMLPYTPLHYLLMADGRWQMADGRRQTGSERSSSDAPSAIGHRLSALVMTSGNFSEEPIATDNDDALTRLAPLADAFLLHNRDIHVRCDDSVVRVLSAASVGTEAGSGAGVYPLRRSRGYAPYPVKLPFDAPPILATGAELKNTFCVTRGEYAFLSHHIGDMENYETLRSFEQGVAHFERLFRIRPEMIAYDLHPNYLATRYALDRAEREGIRAVGVQHHHAHVAACMAENGLTGERPVIGVAFDGTGYGTDGAIWGGEFLVADTRGFERAAHLAYARLPGGDAATRHPYRTALSCLRQAGIEWSNDLPPVEAAGERLLSAINHQLCTGLNAPPTSSMGRLFDAVASIAGVRQTVNYEGQAAIELEALVDATERGTYTFEIIDHQDDGTHGPRLLSATPVVRAVVDDVRAGVPPSIIAARFHNGLAQLILDVCSRIRDERSLNEVALSGGVFQNITLLTHTLDRLSQAGFVVYIHHLVPPNDGGLALGQAAIAAAHC
jgi:hydrogenase maturation protein HypF